MAPKDPEIAKNRTELCDKISKVQESHKAQQDVEYTKATEGCTPANKPKLSCKRTLKGHINKVNCVHFSGDSKHLVSGSLDGKLIIWDIFSGNKTQVIPLVSAWVMSCALAPSGNFVASGGMDNQCTIHDLNNRDSGGAAKISRELIGYEGFLSSNRFLDDTNLITGSGDQKVIHWNLNTGDKVHEWFGHSGDVATMSLAPDQSCFITGSVDRTIKLWDLRDPKDCKQTFWGHASDINAVAFHPSGQAFVSASEDKTSRLWDIRSDQQVAEFKAPTANSAFTACGLSKSGRHLFSGSDDNQIHIWDILTTTHQGVLSGHENKVTSVAVSDDGFAVASCSWDFGVRVWG